MANTPVARPTNAVSTQLAEWGDVKPNTGDLVLSKILPMQGMSQLVTDGKAQVGEFRDSVTSGKIGSIVEPFLMLPFHVEKFWDIMVQEQGQGGQPGQFKWDRSEPLQESPAVAGYNDNLPWEDTLDGTPIKRVRRMNFYCMLPQEIADGVSIPYVFSFKSTSYREGKKIYTQMFLRNKRAGLPPPGYLFKVAGIKAKNQAGQTYIIPTVELARKATDAEIAECLNWFKTIKSGVVKVDNSDLEAPSQMEFDVSGAPEAGSVGEF